MGWSRFCFVVVLPCSPGCRAIFLPQDPKSRTGIHTCITKRACMTFLPMSSEWICNHERKGCVMKTKNGGLWVQTWLTTALCVAQVATVILPQEIRIKVYEESLVAGWLGASLESRTPLSTGLLIYFQHHVTIRQIYRPHSYMAFGHKRRTS